MSWLDRAKENNGGRYSERHVESVKVLTELFPLYGLQLLYRACVTQIPSGYYIQAMNSNLHLDVLLLPIGTMNVVSILPLLLLAPLAEFVTTCLLSTGKTPLAPAKLIGTAEFAFLLKPELIASSSKSSGVSFTPFLLLTSQPSFCSPSLTSPPCPSSPSSSGTRVCRSVCSGGRRVGDVEEAPPLGGADSVWKGSAGVVNAVFPPGASVRPAGRGRSPRHPCMCVKEHPWWHFPPDFLPNHPSSLPGSLISFQLTPSHIRGISLHFLTLSYGGGCFLGALILQLVHAVSGGATGIKLQVACCPLSLNNCELQTSTPTGDFYPNSLQDGNLEGFFFILSTLMAVNTLLFWRVSCR